jgi:hypothetical protein
VQRLRSLGRMARGVALGLLLAQGTAIGVADAASSTQKIHCLGLDLTDGLEARIYVTNLSESLKDVKVRFIDEDGDTLDFPDDEESVGDGETFMFTSKDLADGDEPDVRRVQVSFDASKSTKIRAVAWLLDSGGDLLAIVSCS